MESVEIIKAVDAHLVDYQPSMWADYFITHPNLTLPHQKSEAWMKIRRDELVEKIKKVLKDIKESPLQVLKLIDGLEHLGVGYHFEKEINDLLPMLNNTSFEDDDFLGTSLRFWLLRQHRYKVSSEVFRSFKDEKGSFKEALRSNIPALLAFYQAAYLRIPGEHILDEAVAFTRDILKALLESNPADKILQRKVDHALEIPSHRRMKRLEARLYIPIYQEDEECNQDALELAKLDFQLLQLLHREEVTIVSLWYREIDVLDKLSFARDRVVECYFWALGVFGEPKYTNARFMLTKTFVLITLLDDIYDNYGTLEELRPLTEAIQEWDEEPAKQLGDCYKYFLSVMFTMIREFENDFVEESAFNGVTYFKNIIKEVSKGMLQEIIWRDDEYVPPLKDHLNVTLVTVSYWPVACACFVGLGKEANEDVFNWVSTFPPIIKNSCIILRLMNDITGHKFETDRKNTATSVTCYMKEHDSTVQDACKALRNMTECAWKAINQEFLNLTSIPVSVPVRVINLTRMVETLYFNCDGYSNASVLKDWISLLLVEPLLP